MFQSLKVFGKRFNCVPIINRTLSDRNYPNYTNSERIITIQSIDEFNEKIMKSDTPVIVNFSAAWCHNCTILSPLVESIISTLPRKVVLLKVDVDEYMDLALSFNVSAIPILFALNRGQIRSRLRGLQDIEKIESWIDAFLKTT